MSMDALNLPVGKVNKSAETRVQGNVVSLVLKGLSNKQIGENLGIKEKTVKYHLTRIFRINCVKSRTQLMAKKLQEQP